MRLGDAAIGGAGAVEKDPYRPALGQGCLCGPQGAAIRTSPFDRVSPVEPDHLLQHRHLEQLFFGHEGYRAAHRIGHQRRIQVAGVVADDDQGSVARHVFLAIGAAKIQSPK